MHDMKKKMSSEIRVSKHRQQRRPGTLIVTILPMSHPQHFTEQLSSYTFHHRQCISHDSLRIHMAPLVTRNVHGTRHVPNSYCIGNVHRMVLAILQQNFACRFPCSWICTSAPKRCGFSMCCDTMLLLGNKSTGILW